LKKETDNSNFATPDKGYIYTHPLVTCLWQGNENQAKLPDNATATAKQQNIK
jgi:hypothetical protein